MKKTVVFLVLMLIATALILLWLVQAYPDILNVESDRLRLVSLLLVLALFSLQLFSGKFDFGKGLRDLLVWLGIGAMLMIGYAFKDHLKAQLFSFQDSDPYHPEVRLQIRSNGHFMADGKIDGYPVRFLVDSGASRVLVSREMAKRMQLDVDQLDYTQLASTANGMTRVAPLKFRKIQIGSVVLYDVPGAVASQDLDEPLLGMSFLSRLKSWRVENNILVLQQ